MRLASKALTSNSTVRPLQHEVPHSHRSLNGCLPGFLEHQTSEAPRLHSAGHDWDTRMRGLDVSKVNDHSLYVVYLPCSVTVVEGSVRSFSAYRRVRSAEPGLLLHRPGPTSTSRSSFARPTGGYRGIDNSIVDETAGDSISGTLVDAFTTISTERRTGEAADICAEGAKLTACAPFVPTSTGLRA